MQLTDVLAALRRFRLLAAAVVVLFLLIGLVAAYLPADRFQATSTLTASPAGKNPDYNAVAAVQFMLPAIVQQVETAGFQKEVVRRVRGASAVHDLSISATQAQGSGVIRITAKSRDRNIVVPVSNTAAQVLIKRRLSPIVGLQLLAPALAASSSGAGLRAPIVLSSLVLGMIAAVLAALAANALRGKAVGEQDLVRLDLEIVGRLPRRREVPTSIAQVFTDPSYVELREAFQKLVANLRAASVLDKHRQLAIVSCSGSEGKTTVTSGLAYALALNGSEVMLIDADLRRPRLHEEFELFKATGGFPPSEPFALTTSLENLQVITAIRSVDHPAKVVSQWLPLLLGRYADRFVLVDTPPLLPVADGTLVAHLVSAAIIVVEPGRTERTAFERTVHDLRRANVEILGAVLNRVVTPAEARFYGGYDGSGEAPVAANVLRSLAFRDQKKETSGDQKNETLREQNQDPGQEPAPASGRQRQTRVSRGSRT